jgi:hypothetical protein
MPTAPLYGGQKVNESVTPQVRANTNASAADYGAAVAQGVGQLGEAVSYAARVLDQERNAIKSAKAAERAGLYLAEAGAEQGKYRQGNSFKSAVEALPGAMAKDEELYSKHLSELGPEEQADFAARVAPHRITLRAGSEAHAMNEGRKYTIGSLTASAEANANAAVSGFATGDPLAETHMQRAISDMATALSVQDLPDEEIKLRVNTFNSQIRANGVDALVDNGRLKEALEIAKGDWVKSAPPNIQANMQGMVQDIEASMAAVDVVSGSGKDKTGRVDVIDMNERLAKLFADKSVPPEQAAVIAQRSDKLMRMQNASIDVTAATFLRDADEVAAMARATGQDPVAAVATFKAKNAANYMTLTAEQNKTLSEITGVGFVVERNQNELNHALASGNHELAKATILKMSDAPLTRLGPEGKKKLEDAQKRIMEGNQPNQNVSIGRDLKAAWIQADLGKGNDDDDDFQIVEAQTQRQIDTLMTQKGGFIGKQEIGNIVHNAIQIAKQNKAGKRSAALADPFFNRDVTPENTAELGKMLFMPREQQVQWIRANKAQVYRMKQTGTVVPQLRQYVGQYDAMLGKSLGVSAGMLDAMREKVMLQNGMSGDQMAEVDEILLREYKPPETPSSRDNYMVNPY